MDLKTLVLMANCTFPQAVQNQFSLHWTNSQFGWIRARPEQRLPAELRVCSCSSPGAAVPCLRSSWFSAQWCLDHPTCIPVLGASPLLGAWTGTGGNSRPCSSTGLKAASRQDCSLREGWHCESNNVLWPDKSNAKLPFSCGFDPDTTAFQNQKKASFSLKACGLRFEVVLISLFNYQFWFWKQRHQ